MGFSAFPHGTAVVMNKSLVAFLAVASFVSPWQAFSADPVSLEKVPDVSNIAVPWPPPHDPKDSPFAKMPCTSYASYKANGTEVNPIWGESNPWDFGPRRVAFDSTGVRTLNQIPAPGIHPRIFCTPADREDVARRLKETQCGRELYKNLLCLVNYMKGTYDATADYAVVPEVMAAQGQKARVDFNRLQSDNKTSMAGDRYKALIAGDTTQKTAGFWHAFALEAFRCWVEGDSVGGKNLAAAVTTALKIEQGNRAADPKFAGKPLEQPIAGIHLGYTYDFAYNFLNPDQRKAIHDELANGTWNHDNYGTFNEAVISRSNWATFSYWLIPTLAIEGEPGFNDLKVRGLFRGWRNLMTYGWFPAGANFEGEAKNQLGGDGILAFALRCNSYGFENLAAHPNVRANVKEFTPKSVLPTGDGFIQYDLLGGTHRKPFPSDLLAMKVLLPEDKAIDFAYRAAVGDHYENVPRRAEAGGYEPTVGGGYGNPMIPFLVFATDYMPGNTNPADIGLSNTFFCGDRALMMTRSSWDKNALMLNLHVRQANGGHPFADRNSIMIAGAGRVWSTIYGWGNESWQNINNGEVVIDDHPQAEYTPGRMVDFVDAPDATFAVGDAKYAWDWNWKRIETWGAKGRYTAADLDTSGAVKMPAGFELDNHSLNDFAYLKHPEDYLNAPVSKQPDWLRIKGSITPVAREVNYPVRYAWRTAGIVRGAHPYALVIDDIRKDDTAHDYVWYMPIEHDVQIVKMERHGDNGLDVFLTGDDPTQGHGTVGITQAKDPLPVKRDAKATIPQGQPMLLLRFVNIQNDSKAIPATVAKEPTILEDAPAATYKGHMLQRVRRLAIPAHTIEPGFKVIAYPYHQGDALPESEWTDKKTVAVSWPDQKDRVEFTQTTSGKTNLKVTRGNATLVSVDKPLAPFK